MRANAIRYPRFIGTARANDMEREYEGVPVHFRIRKPANNRCELKQRSVGRRGRK